MRLDNQIGNIFYSLLDFPQAWAAAKKVLYISQEQNDPEDPLNEFLKKELVGACKRHVLRSRGTKKELIIRINEANLASMVLYEIRAARNIEEEETWNNGEGMDDEPDTRNFYEVLKIAPDASLGEIKSAYHTLLKIYHPDLCHGKSSREKKRSEKETITILEAYRVLSNEEDRKIYDQEHNLWDSNN